MQTVGPSGSATNMEQFSGEVLAGGATVGYHGGVMCHSLKQQKQFTVFVVINWECLKWRKSRR